MNANDLPPQFAGSELLLAAALFAVDPAGIGGIVLHAHAGPVRDAWLCSLRDMLPADMPMRKIPVGVTDGRLLGGLDLTASLCAGRPVADRGLLVEANGGIVVLAMAERVEPSTAARLAAVLDSGEVVLAREGTQLRSPARLGVIALDESASDEESVPNLLCERLALRVDLDRVRLESLGEPCASRWQIDAARARMPRVVASSATLEALCATAMALGVDSLRVSLLALRVACASAALSGREEVMEADASTAARLVLAPRATRMPMQQAEEADDTLADDEQDDTENPDSAPPPSADAKQTEEDTEDEQAPEETEIPLDDIVLAAAHAAIPHGLLARIKAAGGALSRARSAGRAGALCKAGLRGRPVGVRRGDPRAGAHLNLIETLRAAAPWQPLRRAERAGHAVALGNVEVRRDDFRVDRYKQRSETTTIFVVDASGSAALHRLSEAKGAVELLLADCYVRRDQVALLSFRGNAAELLLPPTRSLVRAKRSLASLPAGGGTPLAAAVDAAVTLADAVRRRGGTPTIVVLTDGRANIARDGTPGRARAEEDALSASRRLRAAAHRALFVDTSPRPQPAGRQLATEMNALYLPLPFADAAMLSQAVRAAAPPRISARANRD